MTPFTTVAIAAVALCSLYYYLAGWMYLDLEGFERVRYAGRETFLQASLFCLLAQVWYGAWKWFAFSAEFNPPDGWKALAMLIALVFSINWFFRSNFILTAQNRGELLTHQLSDNNLKSLSGAILIVIVSLILWLIFTPLIEFRSSPLDVLKAGAFLLSSGEIWADINVSLLEIVIGVLMGGALAFLVLTVISPVASVRNIAFQLLPAMYISPIVIWLLMFSLALHGGFNLWHKGAGIGLLTFFPFIQALWGLRNHRFFYRVLLAIDDSLPIAFVMMLFTELMAATAGLGFMMTVANATYQVDKSLVGFFITAALLVATSAGLRFTAKRLYMPGPSTNAVGVEAA
jgi:ABC-type nitrate/sulfonate/bicarbonate transport system permease component